MRRLASAVGLVWAVALLAGDGGGTHRQPRRLRIRRPVPLSFEANVGQAAPDAAFVVHAGRSVIALSSQAVVTASGRDRVRMELVGTARVRGEGVGPLPGKANYFIGNQPASWHTGVETFSRVRFRDVWPGIDVLFHGENGELEYDFEVQPEARTEQIRLAFQGASVRPSGGEVLLEGDTPKLTLRQPLTYQVGPAGRRPVDARYAVSGQEVTFRLSGWDRRARLVIDPVLSYSTYWGGSDLNGNHAVALDSAGNLYLTGLTVSSDFPLGSAPYQPFIGGQLDAFVSKLDATGATVLYSTYFGGSLTDFGNAIAVDGAGNAYVAGQTASVDLPTLNPVQAALAGTNNAFLAKLNPTGSALVYSTYWGGSQSDEASGLALDSQRSAYITGTTSSPDFPTVSALHATYGGGSGEAYVAKFNPTGSGLVYSTYLGGSGYDQGLGIATDVSGNAYVTGNTSSPNFPTLNPIQATLGDIGGGDAFITKLNANGSALVYSTYLGGAGGDQGNAVAVDAVGNAYLTGYTDSLDFPLVAPFQAIHHISSDVFVSRINPAGSALVYSTYLGGSDDESGYAIAVDGAGNATVAGQTYSTDFPTLDPLQTPAGGSGDGFLTTFSPAGSMLMSTSLGNSTNDAFNGVAVNGAGDIFAVGTSLGDFPLVNPLRSTPPTNVTGVIVKLIAGDAGVDGGVPGPALQDGGSPGLPVGDAPALDYRVGWSCSSTGVGPVVWTALLILWLLAGNFSHRSAKLLPWSPSLDTLPTPPEPPTRPAHLPSSPRTRRETGTSRTSWRT